MTHEAASLPDPAFDQLLDCWNPLTEAFDELNRSMDLPDLYPFVLSAPAVEKGIRTPSVSRC